MKESFIRTTIDERVATLVLDHPPANTLSRAVLEELDGHLTDLHGSDEVAAIVITGAGKVFSSGADIREISEIDSSRSGEALATRGQAVLGRMEMMNKVIIAAINGLFCLGGGLELAMACHLRIAGEDVRLGLPEVTLGIMPGFGGTQRLPRLIGVPKALELILTGERIRAAEALKLGLVNQVVPDSQVLAQAQVLAKRIGSLGQLAVRAVVRAIMNGPSISADKGFELEAKLFGDLCDTNDMKEGLKAFMEKRPANFRNL